MMLVVNRIVELQYLGAYAEVAPEIKLQSWGWQTGGRITD